ncbi:hypothetical protein EV182_004103 [Spiromyces aspiralis]|uniref:Uncharacterized protein n=1 Tax=Spiromyces aspiralis TaxID=68401 RepID=A0ACC1HC44_9FUNG|nr:hypothetical protein EV182_004103 [Spiromyces aspiralis]
MSGCPFSPEDIELCRAFDQHNWINDSEYGSALREHGDDERKAKIALFASRHPGITADKLRMWLGTSAGTSPAEKRPPQCPAAFASTIGAEGDDQAHAAFKQFDSYDFAADSRFQTHLKAVFSEADRATLADPSALDQKLLEAKAAFFTHNIDALFNLTDYKKWLEVSKPAQVCPYAHLWNPAANKMLGPTDQYTYLRAIDLNEIVDGDGPAYLGPHSIASLEKALQAAIEDERVQAVFIYCSADPATAGQWFLPPLLPAHRRQSLPGTDSSGGGPHFDFKAASELYAAYSRLVFMARRLAVQKPLVVVANGRVHRSTLSLALAGTDMVVTENFAVSLNDLGWGSQAPPDFMFPFSPLFELSHLHEARPELTRGTVAFIMHHPTLIIRGPEACALGLAHSFIPANMANSVLDKMFLASSCPAPHTSKAIRAAYSMKAAYPGPSKIDPWKTEIAEHFAPLCADSGEGAAMHGLYAELKGLGKPWADKYASGMQGLPAVLVEAKHRAIEYARALPYHQCVLNEYNFTRNWWRSDEFAAMLIAAKASSGDGDFAVEAIGVALLGDERGATSKETVNKLEAVVSEGTEAAASPLVDLLSGAAVLGPG